MPVTTPFRRVGVVVRSRSVVEGPVAEHLRRAADEYGLDLYPEAGIEDLFDGPGQLDPAAIDLLVSFGGDGTLLRGARLVARHHTPVLGVNMGHLGFLTSVRPEELEASLAMLMEGAYWLDTRFTLQARVVASDGSVAAEYTALNDAVLHKGGFARVIRFAVRVGEDREEVGSYGADGIILATPTGSTAYSLSAGGAIVAPSMEALLATPISPHTLAVRPLILPADTRVEVEVCDPDAEVVLTVDGQGGEPLVNGDRLVVSRGPDTVPLVRFGGQSFFSTLRRKLHWGAGAAVPDPQGGGPSGY